MESSCLLLASGSQGNQLNPFFFRVSSSIHSSNFRILFLLHWNFFLKWKTNFISTKEVHHVQWNLPIPTCTGRESLCWINKSWVTQCTQNPPDKWSNGNENQCRITLWNGLHRWRIRRVLLYMWYTCDVIYVIHCALFFSA